MTKEIEAQKTGEFGDLPAKREEEAPSLLVLPEDRPLFLEPSQNIVKSIFTPDGKGREGKLDAVMEMIHRANEPNYTQCLQNEIKEAHERERVLREEVETLRTRLDRKLDHEENFGMIRIKELERELAESCLKERKARYGANEELKAEYRALKAECSRLKSFFENCGLAPNDVKEFWELLEKQHAQLTAMKAERDGMRKVAEDLITAWGESYDCSSDPGHNIMGEAVGKAMGRLNHYAITDQTTSGVPTTENASIPPAPLGQTQEKKGEL